MPLKLISRVNEINDGNSRCSLMLDSISFRESVKIFAFEFHELEGKINELALIYESRIPFHRHKLNPLKNNPLYLLQNLTKITLHKNNRELFDVSPFALMCGSKYPPEVQKYICKDNTYSFQAIIMLPIGWGSKYKFTDLVLKKNDTLRLSIKYEAVNLQDGDFSTQIASDIDFFKKDTVIKCSINIKMPQPKNSYSFEKNEDLNLKGEIQEDGLSDHLWTLEQKIFTKKPPNLYETMDSFKFNVNGQILQVMNVPSTMHLLGSVYFSMWGVGNKNSATSNKYLSGIEPHSRSILSLTSITISAGPVILFQVDGDDMKTVIGQHFNNYIDHLFHFSSGQKKVAVYLGKWGDAAINSPATEIEQIEEMIPIHKYKHITVSVTYTKPETNFKFIEIVLVGANFMPKSIC